MTAKVDEQKDLGKKKSGQELDEVVAICDETTQSTISNNSLPQSPPRLRHLLRELTSSIASTEGEHISVSYIIL